MNNIVNVEYQFTSATDHASIIIELSTEIEMKGIGTFKAPPFIQNNEEYSKMVIDRIIDAQMRCKTTSNKKEEMMTLIENRRNLQKIYNGIMENTKCYYYEPWVEKVKEDYAIALSVEPTMEEINDLPSDNRKGTELEMILMELKDLTITFTKNETKKGKMHLKDSLKTSLNQRK